jgi:hypothetical protein
LDELEKWRAEGPVFIRTYLFFIVILDQEFVFSVVRDGVCFIEQRIRVHDLPHGGDGRFGLAWERELRGMREHLLYNEAYHHYYDFLRREGHGFEETGFRILNNVRIFRAGSSTSVNKLLRCSQYI